MNLRTFAFAAALAGATLTATGASAADLPMTAEEFKLWREYQSALEDPRVQKMAEKARLPAIARNFKVAEKSLAAAVAKGDQFGAGIGAQAEQAVREALADTDLAARIKQIRVDTSAAHVIAYVTWLPDAPDQFEREACIAAARTRKAAPIASTIKVEVADPVTAESRLFEALISAESAANINESRIVDFAKTRYIKLFEKVKRAEP